MHAPRQPDSPSPGEPVPVRRQVLAGVGVVAFAALLGWLIHVRSAPPPVPAVNPEPPMGAGAG